MIIDMGLRSGNVMRIGQSGVCIIGEAGGGKSQLSWKLAKRGHCLIADDVFHLSCRGGSLWAAAPEPLQGLIALRQADGSPRIMRCPRWRRQTRLHLIFEIFQDPTGSRRLRRVLNLQLPIRSLTYHRLPENNMRWIDFVEQCVVKYSKKQ